MYLITILRAAEEGHAGPLGLAALGERLAVTAASANEKVRKMEERGLVVYEPYKGASLTEAGRSVAIRVLRTRRLWARFLADRLGFSPREADELACDLEHATSGETADRLDEFLGHPGHDPFGVPIPPADAPSADPGAGPLRAAPPGSGVEIVAVAGESEAAGFLAASGLEPGAIATVEAAGAGGVLLSVAGGSVHLGPALADAVLIRRVKGGEGA